MGTGAAKTETQTDKVAMVSAKKPKAKPEFRFRPVFLPMNLKMRLLIIKHLRILKFMGAMRAKGFRGSLILMCKLVKEVRY
jgi:hypothetical protein